MRPDPPLLRCLIVFYVLTSAYVLPEIHGQELLFKHYTTQQGLPSNECYTLMQDRKGYIWVATDRGLVKHNGTRFVRTCTNLPHSESVIFAFTRTEDGVLYFSNSRKHLYKVRNDSAILVDVHHVLPRYISPTDHILQLKSLCSRWFYIQTREEEFLFQENSNKPISLDSLIESSEAPEIYQEWRGNDMLYVHNQALSDRNPKSQGLVSIRTNNSEMTWRLRGSPSDAGRYFMTELPSGYVFSQPTYGLALARRDGSIKYTYLRGWLSTYKDHYNHIWSGSLGSGLTELDTGLTVLQHHLEGTSVSGIWMDASDGVWVTTLNDGVYYSAMYGIHSVLTLSGGSMMLTAVNDRLFAASTSGILYEYTASRWVDFKGNTERITGIVASNNMLYASTYDGLFKLIPGNRMVHWSNHHGIIDGNLIYDMDWRHPDTVCVFSFNEAYLLTQRNLVRSFDFKRRIRSAITWDENNYLIGFDQGLYLTDLDTCILPSWLERLSTFTIQDLKRDGAGRVLVFTKGEGTYVIMPDKRVLPIPHMPSADIHDILLLDNRTILAAANTGLYFNTLQGVLAATPWYNIYEDEITNVEYYRQKVFFTTRNQLLYFDVNRLAGYDRPEYYFTGVGVNGKFLSATEDLRLNYNQNNPVFYFDFLDYRRTNPRFRYKLEGAFSAASEVEGTELYLHNLPPGNYDLLITPYSARGFAAENTFRLQFCIHPAFWQTLLFRLLALGFVLTLVVLSVRFYFVLQRRRERRENEMDRTLLDLRLTALKSQVNPHFISNALTAIQQQVIKGDADKAGLYLSRFSLFIRNVLKYSDRSYSSLEDELRIAGLYIDLELLRFNYCFEYSVTVADDVQADAVWVPTMITQPFIENAIWHGLLPLTGRMPRLDIYCFREDGMFVIRIDDNGVGRAGSAESKPKQRLHEAKGIQLMMQRLEVLSGLYHQTARVRYTDKKEADGSPAGTRVDIIFSEQLLTQLYVS